MDRHERPYKCHEPECELNAGFTYSGGLLRHQREVHKMHQSTKQPLFCPFPNCNRSSGNGFTRKENLEEHKRRRHLEEMSQQSQSQSPDTHAITTNQTTKKRKRLPTPQPSPVVEIVDVEPPDGVQFQDIESHPVVKKLRLLLAQKDEYIRWQHVELQKLQNLITNLPQQALYNISGMGMMGGGGQTESPYGKMV